MGCLSQIMLMMIFISLANTASYMAFLLASLRNAADGYAAVIRQHFRYFAALFLCSSSLMLLGSTCNGGI